ncbi:hypothetical protein EDD53_1331 [Pacificibacter maritimus]|uniref:Uncharacterized protein n=1 Tax=Pacificibacter maritimus TaxID=762213 RepID=A0A3N4UP39_9RHOB|nr:hypothetical protein EDD53_1331 [Pacificibacter maritimus]
MNKPELVILSRPVFKVGYIIARRPVSPAVQDIMA